MFFSATARRVVFQRRPSTVCDAAGDVSTVTFDVRGHLFKVLRKSVTRQPTTPLALHVASMKNNGHVLIDANPERFSHILDWYVYGEIFCSDASEKAVLRDCSFFQLGDVVVVNGTMKPVLPGPGQPQFRNKVTLRSQFRRYSDDDDDE